MVHDECYSNPSTTEEQHPAVPFDNATERAEGLRSFPLGTRLSGLQHVKNMVYKTLKTSRFLWKLENQPVGIKKMEKFWKQ
jgi:hypothetical protein